MTPAAARSNKTVEECTKPTDIYASCMHAKQVHNFYKNNNFYPWVAR